MTAKIQTLAIKNHDMQFVVQMREDKKLFSDFLLVHPVLFSVVGIGIGLSFIGMRYLSEFSLACKY